MSSSMSSTHSHHTDPPADRDDPVYQAQRVNDLTPGDDLPYCLEWGEDGDGETIATPTTMTPEICELIRELREDMRSVRIAVALDYSETTISDHLRGECRHWTPEEHISFTDTPPAEVLDSITDRTRVISADKYYHAISDGEPACGRTGKSYTFWEDLDQVKVWKSPCKICFPDREDERV